VIGSEHTLDSGNYGFTATLDSGNTVLSQCTSSSFTTQVTSATNLEITAANFGGDCTVLVGGVLSSVCTVDSIANALPWTATAINSSDVQIRGVNYSWTMTQSTPGPGNCPAQVVGQVWTFTGTTTGTWNNAARHLTLSNAEGLVLHSPFPLWSNGTPVTTRATFRDTQQTLTIDNC
jgi:hypothetical protein